MEEPKKTDFRSAVPMRDLANGSTVAGQIDGEDVLLVRREAEFFAVGASCTHYHGPLPEGLLVGDEVRCPWHHACFSLRTGEALRAPALDPIQCWHVEQTGEKVFVGEKVTPAAPRRVSTTVQPSSIIIIGGGAAGLAAAAQ